MSDSAITPVLGGHRGGGAAPNGTLYAVVPGHAVDPARDGASATEEAGWDWAKICTT